MGYPYFRRMGWQTRNKPFITRTGRMIVPLYSDGFSVSLHGLHRRCRGKLENQHAARGRSEHPTRDRRGGPRRTGGVHARQRPAAETAARQPIDRTRAQTWSPVRDSELPNSGTACDIVTLPNGHWVLVNNDTEPGATG
jgi:hypothetical protein